MTSLKSSSDRYTAAFDFKRCFIRLIPPSLISLAVSILYFIIMPLSAIRNYSLSNGKESIAALRKTLCCALTYTTMSYAYIGVIAIIVGVIFAFWIFFPIMRKNSVNFYFSGGISRKTFFKNRVFACVILIAVSIFAPIIIDIGVNIHYFGHAEYIIYQGLLLFAEHFIYTLAGFSLMATAMSICYTVTQSLLLGAAFIWTPTLLTAIFTYTAQKFLRGFSLSMDILRSSASGESALTRTSVANPLLLGNSLNGNSAVDNLYSFSYRYSKTQTYFDSLSEYSFGFTKAGMSYILPLIIWLALSILIIFAAYGIFRRRALENTAIVNTSDFTNLYVGVFTALCVFLVSLCYSEEYISVSKASLNDMLRSNEIITALVSTAAFMVSYFVITAIIRRKIKPNKKCVLSAALCVLCIIALISACKADIFGYSEYAPDYDDIEYATVSGSYVDAAGTMGANYYDNDYLSYSIDERYSFYNIGKFTEKSSIDKIKKIQAKAAEFPTEERGSAIYVYYVLKSGRVITRTFTYANASVEKEVLSLTDTAEYRDELEFLFSPSRKDEKSTGNYDEDVYYYGSSSASLSFINEKQYKNCLRKGTAQLIAEDGVTKSSIGNTDELKEAMLKDLESVGYIKLLTSDEPALGALKFKYEYTDEYYDYMGYAADDSGIINLVYYIFPSMTNTIEYLKSVNAYDALSKSDLSSPVSVKVYPVKSLAESINLNIYDISMTFESTSVNEKAYEAVYSGESGLNDVFENEGTEITDASKISELLDNSSIYSTVNTDGYVILVEYKDSTYVTKYVAGKNAPDFIKNI